MAIGAIAGGAVLGGLAGGLSSGSLGAMSELGNYNQVNSLEALKNYQQLVSQGPSQADYTRGLQAQRDLANTLTNINSSASGMYNFGVGNQLASQAFAGQRESLNQAFSQQLQQASRAAALSGRSTNDPILRARLAQQQTNQLAQLQANQSSAAVNFARQAVTDQITNQTNAANTLSNLGQGALTNQANLFNMNQSSLANERSWLLQQAQNERAAGGGLKGAITGALGGASAGFQLAQGFGGMMGGGGGAASAPTDTGMAMSAPSGFQAAQSYFSGSNPFAGSGYIAPAAPQAAAPAAAFAPSFNSNNFANFQQRGMMGGF